MKQTKKNYLFLLALFLLVSTLAACGNESNIQILEETNAQPVYLSFFSDQSMAGSDVTKYWIEQFMEKYNKQIYINFDGATYYAEEGLSYRELLEKRLESSAPDDMYIIKAEDVLEFEKKGYWMDLSDLAFVDNLSEAALYQSTYNGKVFSLPLSFTGFGFVWNVDMLEEYDLQVPQNLEEFLTTCEKLKSEGILPYGANKGSSLTVPAMCVGFSKLYNSDNREEQIDALNRAQIPVSEYLREGFSFLELMIENGYLDPEQALAATPRKEDAELFLDGGCAFICAGLGDFRARENIPFQTQMTGLPVLSEGSIAVYGANRRLCVNPNSKNLDTVYDFIEMVGTSEALAESAAIDKVMSSAKDSSLGDFPIEEKLVELLGQPGQIPNQDFSLHFNTWESIRDVAREICAGRSVEEACEMLDEKQLSELKDYGQME